MKIGTSRDASPRRSPEGRATLRTMSPCNCPWRKYIQSAQKLWQCHLVTFIPGGQVYRVYFDEADPFLARFTCLPSLAAHLDDHQIPLSSFTLHLTYSYSWTRYAQPWMLQACCHHHIPFQVCLAPITPHPLTALWLQAAAKSLPFPPLGTLSRIDWHVQRVQLGQQCFERPCSVAR